LFKDTHYEVCTDKKCEIEIWKKKKKERSDPMVQVVKASSLPGNRKRANLSQERGNLEGHSRKRVIGEDERLSRQDTHRLCGSFQWKLEVTEVTEVSMISEEKKKRKKE
jgi:hypothetical protein